MKKKATVTILSILFCIVFAAGAFASAKEIRGRMIARLPEIKALKAKGLVGENKSLSASKKKNRMSSQPKIRIGRKYIRPLPNSREPQRSLSASTVRSK